MAAVAVMLAGSRSARGQRVTGVVYDSAARVPLPGVVVEILNGAAVSVSRTSTDGAGHFVIQGGSPAGTLRAIRIGYRPVTLAFPPTIADTTIELSLARLPSLLETVHVADRPLCPRSDDRGSAFQLWEQVRAGLTAATLTRDVNPATTTTVVFRRRLAPGDGGDEAVRHESREMRRGESTKPFASGSDARTLAARGFMAEDPTGRTFIGPDEDVLLDESFAATHCLRVQASDSAHDGQIGLAFAPAMGRDTLVEVAGVIWMDAAPLALRSLDFSFIGLEPAAMRARPGGHIEFRPALPGVPMAASWSLRLPTMMATVGTPFLPRRSSARERTRRTDVRLAEIVETSAEVLDMTWPDGTVFRADSTGIVGHAAPYAALKIEGTSITAVADSNGAFVFSPLQAGAYRVTAVDTAFAAYLDQRSHTARAEVRGGHLAALRLPFSSIGELAASACKRSGTATGSDLFGHITLASTAPGKPQLRASWEARRDSADSDRYADVDDRGNIRLCGIARHVPITLHVRIGRLEADTTLTLDASVVNGFQWMPALAAVTAVSKARTVRGIVADSANRRVSGVSATLTLPTVVTSASSINDQRLTTFLMHQRAAAGGFFLRPVVVDGAVAHQSAHFLIQGLPGVRMTFAGGQWFIFMKRPPAYLLKGPSEECTPRFLLNGQYTSFTYDELDKLADSGNLLGVEVYTRDAQMPGDFGRAIADACGFVAFWVKE